MLRDQVMSCSVLFFTLAIITGHLYNIYEQQREQRANKPHEEQRLRQEPTLNQKMSEDGHVLMLSMHQVTLTRVYGTDCI